MNPSSDKSEEGMDMTLKFSDDDIDIIATLAEKDGYYDLEEYVNAIVRTILYENWFDYEISLLMGIAELQQEDRT